MHYFDLITFKCTRMKEHTYPEINQYLKGDFNMIYGFHGLIYTQTGSESEIIKEPTTKMELKAEELRQRFNDNKTS